MFCNDNEITNKHQVKKNYRYFSDVMQRCFEEEDHNTTLMLQNALEHSSIKLFAPFFTAEAMAIVPAYFKNGTVSRKRSIFIKPRVIFRI